MTTTASARGSAFLFPSLFFALALGLAACSSEVPGHDTPESVLHDPDQDVYFVTSIRGAPLEKDGNGYISRVRPDGGMQRYWIQGGKGGVTLHAPKGMGLAGSVLWVADIDVVRKFDRHSGKPLGEVVIPGATFLNDVSVAPDGTVYCSDSGLDAQFAATGTDAIWRIGQDGQPTPLAKTPDLGQPNGIVAREQGVYVVSWRDGTFYQIDTKGRRTDLGKAPQAQLDGLVRTVTTGENGVEVQAWLATSWAGSCIYRFDTSGACSVVGEPLEQPADIGVDAKRARLLVPLFGRNQVVFRQL